MSARGPYAKGRAKRDEIVAVALDLFSKMGYDRTSVREIARLTGLTQAGLLHHFQTKEELFLEVLRQRDVRNERQYDVNHGNPVTISGLVGIVRHNADEPGLVRLYATMSVESTNPNGATRQFFLERYKRLVSDVAEDVAHQQADGELVSNVDPEAVASLLVAAADGLQVQWLLNPGSFDMSDRLEQLSALLRTSITRA